MHIFVSNFCLTLMLFQSDEGIKKNSESHLSNLTKDTRPDEKGELSNDEVDENIMLRKKRKRFV